MGRKAYLVQVPGIAHEEDALSSQDSPHSDHATLGVMQLGPRQSLTTISVCQKGILAQLIQPCIHHNLTPVEVAVDQA